MHSLQVTAVVRLFLALWLAITPTFVWAGSVPLLGAGGGTAAVSFSISNTDNKTDPGVGSTVTYTVGGASSGSNPNIGAADANRIVAVGIAARISGTQGVSSVSINGSAASQCTGAAVSNTAGSTSDIWYLAVPSGTTATVAVTFASATTVSGISVYRIVPTFSVPDSGKQNSSTSATSLSATSLAVTAGGGFIAMGYSQSASTMGFSAPAGIVNDAGTGIALSGARTFNFAHDVIDSGTVTATVTGTVTSSMDLSLCSWH